MIKAVVGYEKQALKGQQAGVAPQFLQKKKAKYHFLEKCGVLLCRAGFERQSP
jgi:hypothetical protein